MKALYQHRLDRGRPSSMAAILATLTWVSLSGCGDAGADGSDTEGEDCSAQAIPAVQVAVVPDGAAATPTEEDGLSVRYALDGREAGDCVLVSPGRHTCGWDAGNYLVTGTANGFAPTQARVDVQLDAAGCHPVQRAVELAFRPLAP